MKKICNRAILTVFVIIVILSEIIGAQGFIIDHNCTNLDSIPPVWLDSVKQNIRFHFGHRSHGRQLTNGMDDIEIMDQIYNINYDSNFINYTVQEGSLNIFNRSQYIDEYLNNVKAELDSYPDLNVSLFVWCVEFMVDMYTEDQVNEYLDSINSLESLYPNVTFIYSTASAGDYGPAGGYNRYLRNQQIRNFCINQNKILFDFGDLDSWWWNSENGNWEQQTFTYNPGSGDIEIPTQHEQYGTAWVTDVHINQEGWLQKGKAAWWMFARISGWEGTPVPVDKRDEKKCNIPEIIKLNQNYPNPFNPTTVVSYQLPAFSQVELTVYNTLGQIVRMLVNQKQNTGIHRVWFDASGLTSGIYIYRLQAGNFVQLKKMLLIK